MLAQEYLAFKRDLEAKGVTLSFSGGLSESLLSALGESLRAQLRLDAADARTAKRVFSVFVEVVQNVIRYAAEPPVRSEASIDFATGVLCVGMVGNEFFVVCGNVVKREHMAVLQRRLEDLQCMDREELRAAYRRRLKEPGDPESKGASLGLIEIARRASGPIEFDFADIDEDLAFFSLKARI